MANSGREKKTRLTVNIDESNFILLHWLKINYRDGYSFTVNNLISRYKMEITEGMTDFEREQIENLKIINDRGAIDLKRINNLRSAALLDKVDATLKDDKKRQALMELIELYGND